jgi:hypothetical protein
VQACRDAEPIGGFPSRAVDVVGGLASPVEAILVRTLVFWAAPSVRAPVALHSVLAGPLLGAVLAIGVGDAGLQLSSLAEPVHLNPELRDDDVDRDRTEHGERGERSDECYQHGSPSFSSSQGNRP